METYESVYKTMYTEELINLENKKKKLENSKEHNKAIEEELKDIKYRQLKIVNYSYAMDVLKSYIYVDMELAKKYVSLRNNSIYNILKLIELSVSIYFTTKSIISSYNPKVGWTGLLYTPKVYLGIILGLVVGFLVTIIISAFILDPIAERIYRDEDRVKLKKDLEYLEKQKDIVLKIQTKLYIKTENGCRVVKNRDEEVRKAREIINEYETKYGTNKEEYIVKEKSPNKHWDNCDIKVIYMGCTMNGEHYDAKGVRIGSTMNGEHYDANGSRIGSTYIHNNNVDMDHYDANGSRIGSTYIHNSNVDMDHYDANGSRIGSTYIHNNNVDMNHYDAKGSRIGSTRSYK